MNTERCIDRFDKYMIYSGLNDNQVTKDAELSVGTIGKSRQENRDLSNRVLNKLLQVYPEISRVWLLTGEGQMLVGDTPETEEQIVGQNLSESEFLELKNKGLELVPEYSEAFRAGNAGNMLYTDAIASYWSLPNVHADMIIPVEGDSMAPVYPSGTKLAVRKFFFSPDEPYSIPFGEVYAIVVRYTQEDPPVCYIKRLKRHDDRDRAPRYWVAYSDNPTYPPFEIPIDKIVSLWRVAASITIGS